MTKTLEHMALEAIVERLDDNFTADLEHGVAWMNDEASVEFAKKYPRLLVSITEVREYLANRT
jgi:hypothetical protein